MCVGKEEAGPGPGGVEAITGEYKRYSVFLCRCTGMVLCGLCSASFGCNNDRLVRTRDAIETY